MTGTLIWMVLGSIILAGLITGLYLLIKRLIKYNAEVKKQKSKMQEEWDKMKIDDL